MMIKTPALRGLAAAALLSLALPMAAHAQNLAVVTGKPLPQARTHPLSQQGTRSGRHLPRGTDPPPRSVSVTH